MSDILLWTFRSKLNGITNNSIKHKSINTVKWLYNSISKTSILHKSFVYTQFKRQFYLTQRLGPFRCYHSGPLRQLVQCQWRVPSDSPKLQDWSLTIRLFDVISRTLVMAGFIFLQRCSWCILQPLLTG